MAEKHESGRRFYCPGCDKFKGPGYGGISGAWLCDECEARGVKIVAPDDSEKPKKRNRSKGGGS